MWEIIQAAGWPIWPLIFASIIALAIIGERAWSLRDPLLGLFGTTIGMIEMFSAQTPSGLNPVQLAHGISIALYNTAFGLVVAIPSMIFYRHYRAKVDALIIGMEQQAVRLVDILHAGRAAQP